VALASRARVTPLEVHRDSGAKDATAGLLPMAHCFGLGVGLRRPSEAVWPWRLLLGCRVPLRLRIVVRWRLHWVRGRRLLARPANWHCLGRRAVFTVRLVPPDERGAPVNTVLSHHPNLVRVEWPCESRRAKPKWVTREIALQSPAHGPSLARSVENSG